MEDNMEIPQKLKIKLLQDPAIPLLGIQRIQNTNPKRYMHRVPWTARRSIQSHSKGDQPWDFFGRNDAKAETPVLWPSHAKS